MRWTFAGAGAGEISVFVFIFILIPSECVDVADEDAAEENDEETEAVGSSYTRSKIRRQ